MKERAQTCCNKANKMKVNVIKNTMLATEFDPHSQKKDHYCCLKTRKALHYYHTQLCTQNWGKADGHGQSLTGNVLPAPLLKPLFMRAKR